MLVDYSPLPIPDIPLFGELDEEQLQAYIEFVVPRLEEAETLLRSARNTDHMLEIVAKFNGERQDVPESEGGLYAAGGVMVHGVHVSIRNDRRGNIWLEVDPKGVWKEDPRKQTESDPEPEVVDGLVGRLLGRIKSLLG